MIAIHCLTFLVDLTAPVSCTACHHEINIKKPGSVQRHPVLAVLLCKVSVLFNIEI